MDLNALREMAIEVASRALYEKGGFGPSEESDEWEAEYRRQFAALKQRYGSQVTVPSRPAAAATPQRQLPELSGTPEQLRWAASQVVGQSPRRAAAGPAAALKAAIRRLPPQAGRSRGGAQGRSTEEGGGSGRLSAKIAG